MGIIVRNMNMSNFSNVRLGSLEPNIIPFTMDSIHIKSGMSKEDIENLVIGENKQQGLISGTGTSVGIVYDEVLGKNVFQFNNTTTDVKFPAFEPRLTGRNFRIKYKVYQVGNRYNTPYSHGLNDRNILLFGHTTYWNHIIVNNNSGTPKIKANINTHYVNKWAEFEWSYNRSNSHWQMLIDGVRYINSTWTIQQYTKVEEFFSLQQGSGNRLDYYKIQIEGINWSGNFDEAW